MINSQGHVIFEQPLAGSGASLVDMFIMDKVYSCFVRGDTVTIFKEYLQVGQINIEEVSDLPAEFTGVFEPLELLYNDDKLRLTAKVGTAEGKNFISVFDINFNELKAESVSQFEVGKFESTSRTKSHVLFHVDDKKSQSFAFDPFRESATPSKEIYKNLLQASINDDFIFTEEARYVEYLDLSRSTADRTQIKG